MAKQTYPVLSNLLHDGTEYGPAGKRAIVLEDAAAQALVDAGVLGEGEPVAEAPVTPATAIEREAALLQLVPSFTVGDFTQAGLMRADARRRVAAQLGFEPSDDEIRAAGEAYAKQIADRTD